MEKNIFKLDNEQLKAIVCSFRDKTEEGLKTENAEIQCIPTFIAPKTTHIKGKSLVLDLGGTNYRVAIVDFDKATPTVHPNNGWKKDMSIMKSVGSVIVFLIRPSPYRVETPNCYAGQKE